MDPQAEETLAFARKAIGYGATPLALSGAVYTALATGQPFFGPLFVMFVVFASFAGYQALRGFLTGTVLSVEQRRRTATWATNPVGFVLSAVFWISISGFCLYLAARLPFVDLP